MDQFRYALRKTAYAVEDVVSLDQAQRNCSVDGDEHDDTLVELIRQAIDYVEENTDASLLTTTWTMTFDAFPRRKWLYLPRWPLQSIDSIQYTDAAGDLQTLPAESIVARIDDHGRGRIALKQWADWPTVQNTPDAVQVVFKAGWTQAADVPNQWTRAMLMLIAWWFEQREAGVVGTSAAAVPLGVEALIASAATSDDFGDFDLCD